MIDYGEIFPRATEIKNLLTPEQRQQLLNIAEKSEITSDASTALSSGYFMMAIEETKSRIKYTEQQQVFDKLKTVLGNKKVFFEEKNKFASGQVI